MLERISTLLLVRIGTGVNFRRKPARKALHAQQRKRFLAIKTLLAEKLLVERCYCKIQCRKRVAKQVSMETSVTSLLAVFSIST